MQAALRMLSEPLGPSVPSASSPSRSSSYPSRPLSQAARAPRLCWFTLRPFLALLQTLAWRWGAGGGGSLLADQSLGVFTGQ